MSIPVKSYYEKTTESDWNCYVAEKAYIYIYIYICIYDAEYIYIGIYFMHKYMLAEISWLDIILLYTLNVSTIFLWVKNNIITLHSKE